MGFSAKRGATGWPSPQARQITGWAKRYGLNCHERTAQTGTVYLTLTAESGEEITVRVADHADAYCTATYTVDPAWDQRNAVKAWIQKCGNDTQFRDRVSERAKLTREFNRLYSLIPLTQVSFKNGHITNPLPWIYTPEGEAWYCPDPNRYGMADVENIREYLSRIGINH